MSNEAAIILSVKDKAKALDLALEGKGLKDIALAIGITYKQFWEYRLKDTLFETELRRARAEALEYMVDSLDKIPEDIADVQRARLKSDNIKWIASKRKPEVYGDRLDINVKQEVDIGAALLEARSRAQLPVFDSRSIVNAESSMITITSTDLTTDTVSVTKDLEDLLS